MSASQPHDRRRRPPRPQTADDASGFRTPPLSPNTRPNLSLSLPHTSSSTTPNYNTLEPLPPLEREGREELKLDEGDAERSIKLVGGTEGDGVEEGPNKFIDSR